MYLIQHWVSGSRKSLKEERSDDQTAWDLFLECCQKAQAHYEKTGRAQYVDLSFEVQNQDPNWVYILSYHLE